MATSACLRKTRRQVANGMIGKAASASGGLASLSTKQIRRMPPFLCRPILVGPAAQTLGPYVFSCMATMDIMFVLHM